MHVRMAPGCARSDIICAMFTRLSERVFDRRSVVPKPTQVGDHRIAMEGHATEVADVKRLDSNYHRLV